MLKKSAVLFSYHSLQPLGPAVPCSKSRTSSSQATSCRAQHRMYAMVSGGHSKHDHGSMRWPEKTSVNGIPTPYQIFNQKKGSKYSKERFYELVKIYHPDRHDHTGDDGLTYATKLERYRLIIAANNILSDPAKRGAYDVYGAGWNGQPDVTSPRDRSDSPHTWGGYRGRGWAGGPNGPSQNATWEDWERWYQQDGRGEQKPQYVSNTAFVFLIFIFAVVGGLGQVTRVGNYSMNVLEHRDTAHSEMSKDLMSRRKQTARELGARGERVDNFLKQRDPIGYGITDPKEERYRKLLPAPEICSSEDIKGRNMAIYRVNGKDSKGG